MDGGGELSDFSPLSAGWMALKKPLKMVQIKSWFIVRYKEKDERMEDYGGIV